MQTRVVFVSFRSVYMKKGWIGLIMFALSKVFHLCFQSVSKSAAFHFLRNNKKEGMDGDEKRK